MIRNSCLVFAPFRYRIKSLRPIFIHPSWKQGCLNCHLNLFRCCSTGRGGYHHLLLHRALVSRRVLTCHHGLPGCCHHHVSGSSPLYPTGSGAGCHISNAMNTKQSAGAGMDPTAQDKALGPLSSPSPPLPASRLPPAPSLVQQRCPRVQQRCRQPGELPALPPAQLQMAQKPGCHGGLGDELFLHP